MLALTMPLSSVHVSPLSVRVTGSFTLTLAIAGIACATGVVWAEGLAWATGFDWAACCAAAPCVWTTARARIVDTQRSRALVMTPTFQTSIGMDGLELAGFKRSIVASLDFRQYGSDRPRYS
jgi:hypothetical protein